MATAKVTSGFSRQAELLDSWASGPAGASRGLPPRPKAVLLGLPCARCRAYFDAELDACPICGCNERVVIGKRLSLAVM